MEKGSKILMALVLAVVAVGGASTAFIIDALQNVPNFAELRRVVTVPIELANREKSTRKMGPLAAGWVPIGAISNGLIGAVISSEDSSFFSHEGVDYHELKEAIKKDFQEKRWARGASTITQQVVKNVYLGSQKTLWRKFKEFIWAQKMDKALSKNEILAFYLNMAEWGPGLYGIGQAARHYFNTTPDQITAKQGAFLAMLLPSPKKYHSYFQKKKLTDWAEGRVNKVLHVMNKMGFIDEGAYQAALSENLWEVGDPSSATDSIGTIKQDPIAIPPEAEPLVEEDANQVEPTESLDSVDASP